MLFNTWRVVKEKWWAKYTILAVLSTSDVTIMTSFSLKKFSVSQIKFPTNRIFRISYILKSNRIMLFCNLFMERPSYFLLAYAHHLRNCSFVTIFSSNITW